jgi:hypothetical protein
MRHAVRHLSATDRRLMRRALDLARLGLGRTSPNPPVGAVIARDGEVVAEGFGELHGCLGVVGELGGEDGGGGAGETREAFGFLVEEAAEEVFERLG